MRKIISLLLFLILCSNYLLAQNRTNKNFKFVFLPPGLNFMPLKAGIDEPRMGILYYTKNSNLKVDIGNSVDVFEFRFPVSKSKITVGADFMAYAYVTSYLAYRLQIDALDGFFGGNITYSKKLSDGRFVIRFRYIHHSAHLADGHWDFRTSSWINNRGPLAYGNNYAEILLAREYSLKETSILYYGGVDMSTGKYISGNSLKRFSYKAGFEFALKNLIGKVFKKNENIFIAANFDDLGIPEYIVNQNYLVGIKFGDWNRKGLTFYANYYNGGDVFSQYFSERVSRFGLGVMFDFF